MHHFVQLLDLRRKSPQFRLTPFSYTGTSLCVEVQVLRNQIQIGGALPMEKRGRKRSKKMSHK